MDIRQMEYFISTCEGVGRKTIEALLSEFGTVEEIYRAEEEKLMKVKGLSETCRKRLLDEGLREKSVRKYEQLSKNNIHYCFFLDEKYPKRLRNLVDYPKHLFVKGTLPGENRVSVGIVGARNCSYYGRDMARLFGYRLAAAGVDVISGMAKGIDGWAHQGALEGGGRTFAVLGCGVDVCYPPIHQRLYGSITRSGGVLSEFVPGTAARANYFPLRNRIISGLSDGILVVEAREKSGSLITADSALEQGKDVFVVPGRIGDMLSVGCNRLIRQGAIPVLSPEDILEYYGISHSENGEGLTGLEKELYEVIYVQPISMQKICEIFSDYSPTEIMKKLLQLQRKDRVREVSRGYYVRNE